MMQMPRYQSHKQVCALKIKAIEDHGSHFLIIPADEGYFPFRVEHDYVRKHNPRVGGYYVVYEDGYKSWSPADAFEQGYTRIRT